MNNTSNQTNKPDRHLHMVDALSRAVAAVTSELSLPRTLQAIVDIARELVDARYAALGVPNEDGTLKAFITSGIDSATASSIGHEPRGRGLLGAILETTSRSVWITCWKTALGRILRQPSDRRLSACRSSAGASGWATST